MKNTKKNSFGTREIVEYAAWIGGAAALFIFGKKLLGNSSFYTSGNTTGGEVLSPPIPPPGPTDGDNNPDGLQTFGYDVNNEDDYVRWLSYIGYSAHVIGGILAAVGYGPEEIKGWIQGSGSDDDEAESIFDGASMAHDISQDPYDSNLFSRQWGINQFGKTEFGLNPSGKFSFAFNTDSFNSLSNTNFASMNVADFATIFSSNNFAAGFGSNMNFNFNPTGGGGFGSGFNFNNFGF